MVGRKSECLKHGKQEKVLEKASERQAEAKSLRTLYPLLILFIL